MATPVYCSGFESGVLNVFWNTLVGASTSISTSIVRTGNRSLRSNPSAALTGSVKTNLINSTFYYVFRVYVRFESLPSTDTMIFGVVSTPRSGVYFKSSDSKLYPGTSSTYGSEGISVTTGIWYLIDLRVDSSANPWLIDMKVNNVSVAQASTVNTSQNINQIMLGSDTTETFDIYFDDFIFSETSADYPFGAGKVEHYIPTSDGSHNIAGTADFRRTGTTTDILNATTTAYQLVDDVPLESGASVDWINMLAPPNATDYVECVFGPAPGISAATVAPRAVEVIAGIHQAGTGSGNMEIRLNDNGTMGTVYTATAVAGVTSVAYKRAHFADPPSAATAWHILNDGSNGDFLDLRVRFGSPAALDVNPDQYFDCIMIEAEFPEVVVTIPNKIVQVNQAVCRANCY